MNIKEGSIVILEDRLKENFIKDFRSMQKSLFAITVLGLREFKKKYFFDYNKETVYYVHKKYNVIKEIAEIYIENLYFLGDTVVSSPKIDFLRSLKKDLEEHGKLIYDSSFRNFLKNKDIFLYETCYVDQFYLHAFKNLEKIANVAYFHNKRKKNFPTPLYAFPNKEEEIAFVATSISKLIKSGISVDRIKVANVKDQYIFPIKRIFQDFHIPIVLEAQDSIASTLMVSEFKKNFSSAISKTLEDLKKLIHCSQDADVYKKIVSLLNEYSWCNDYEEVKDFIFKDLNAILQESLSYDHTVRTVPFTSGSFSDEDYVFLIHFNQGAIPILKKDEDYLNDEEKESLGISTSVAINKSRKEEIQDLIQATSHLVVTYSTHNLDGELYISNAFSEELFQSCTSTKSFTESDSYNKKVLLCCKDEYKKYGTVSEDFFRLLEHYKDFAYESYDNSFKKIDSVSLAKQFKNELILSYSSMDVYYHCSFRYYLDYILKVDKFEDTFATIIGSLFHEMLSKCFQENFNFDLEWNTILEKSNYVFEDMEKFYLELLKAELHFIIENIKEMNHYTSLNKSLYEQKIVVPVDPEKGIFFKGFVDKILYEDENPEKVAAIIDYKTGNPKLTIDNIIYGLDLQLPVYAYLLKHFEVTKDAHIGGFYLQKILSNIKDTKEKVKNLKLQGYSNADHKILRLVDNSYEDSHLIKSMRVTSNGDFYKHSKVLSDKEIDQMVLLVEEKIKEAAAQILDGAFTINPKMIGNTLTGCTFCKYEDICYRKNEDIKQLKAMKKEDFLGSDTHGLD